MIDACSLLFHCKSSGEVLQFREVIIMEAAAEGDHRGDDFHVFHV